MVLNAREIAGAHELKIVECHSESFRMTLAKGRPINSRVISKGSIGASRSNHSRGKFCRAESV
jgi:hypothetical protein